MITEVLEKLPENIKTYKKLSMSGSLEAQYEKDENGVWQDVTERAKAEIELKEAKNLLNKLSLKAAEIYGD